MHGLLLSHGSHTQSLHARTLSVLQALVLLGWVIVAQAQDPEYAALTDEGEVGGACKRHGVYA